jgi:2-keto-4-pentenoate hydratase/2-oxohepta-3-ene-1,7-dioic acid hydratase in catechol pathway
MCLPVTGRLPNVVVISMVWPSPLIRFGPLGPVIVSPKHPAIAGSLQDGLPNLNLRTLVNGELRQETNTDDLLFRLSSILEYISLGRTVKRGTAILTGTPSGVAAFLNPPLWLKTGDVVQVEIEHLGIISNTMVVG